MKYTNLSFIYDIFMAIVICLSLMPLILSGRTNILSPFWIGLDQAVLFVFGLDYLLQAHWNYKYCFSLIGVIDFISVLPLSAIPFDFLPISVLPWIRILKLARFWRAFRALKLLRFLPDTLLYRVLKKQKTALLLAWSLAVCYIFMIAVLMYSVEQSAFANFSEALYFSVMTLTSVGYGDVVAVTLPGRLVAMASMFIGTALVALPVGIISAGYMVELRNENEK